MNIDKTTLDFLINLNTYDEGKIFIDNFNKFVDKYKSKETESYDLQKEIQKLKEKLDKEFLKSEGLDEIEKERLDKKEKIEKLNVRCFDDLHNEVIDYYNEYRIFDLEIKRKDFIEFMKKEPYYELYSINNAKYLIIHGYKIELID
jgi:cell division protein FtsL